MTSRWQVPAALLLLVAASVVTVALVRLRPEPEAREPAAPVPAVRVVAVRRGPVRVVVESEGTVAPRAESDLVAEVPGRVTWVAPELAPGRFVRRGQVLVRLDPRDQDAAVAAAEAALARERLRLAREEADAEVARREWAALGQGEAGPLASRELQLEEARAAVAGAAAEVARARADRERTRLTAPFDGRVQDKAADVGQYVPRGQRLARLSSVDAAEVRLTVPDEDLRWLDLAIGPAGDGAGPEVVLSARFAGRDAEWTGRVVRTEGEIDPRTRLVPLVARVEDPYGLDADPWPTPLVAGLFVHARLLGREIPDAAVLPRAALRGEDEVWTVDERGLLRRRRVEVLRVEADRVLVGAGLAAGDRVVVTPLDVATDGMAVAPEEDGAGA